MHYKLCIKWVQIPMYQHCILYRVNTRPKPWIKNSLYSFSPQIIPKKVVLQPAFKNYPHAVDNPANKL